MLKISHLTLDFPLSYLQIQSLLKGHFCLTELLQWEVTFYRWWPEALIEETQQEVGARRLSAADTTQPRLVLKTSPSSTRPLRFPKLLMTCHFCNWFADDFLLFQKTRTNDRRNQVQPGYVWPFACFHKKQTCPPGIKMCRGGQLMKTEKLPGEFLLPAQVSFFCFVFVIKGAVSPHIGLP